MYYFTIQGMIYGDFLSIRKSSLQFIPVRCETVVSAFGIDLRFLY